MAEKAVGVREKRSSLRWLARVTGCTAPTVPRPAEVERSKGEASNVNRSHKQDGEQGSRSRSGRLLARLGSRPGARGRQSRPQQAQVDPLPLDFRLGDLPDDCLELIFLHLGPQDVCQLAQVSRRVQKVADSDAVWEHMLPAGGRVILQMAHPTTVDYPSVKEEVRALCAGVLYERGRQHFQIDARWRRVRAAVSVALSHGTLLNVIQNDPFIHDWRRQQGVEGSPFAKVAYLNFLDSVRIEGEGLELACPLPPGRYRIYWQAAVLDRSVPTLLSSYRAHSRVTLNATQVEREFSISKSRCYPKWLELELGEVDLSGEWEQRAVLSLDLELTKGDGLALYLDSLVVQQIRS